MRFSTHYFIVCKTPFHLIRDRNTPRYQCTGEEAAKNVTPWRRCSLPALADEYLKGMASKSQRSLSLMGLISFYKNKTKVSQMLPYPQKVEFILYILLFSFRKKDGYYLFY